MHLIYRKTCRVCGSAALSDVFDLGEQYLQGSFVKPGKEVPPTRRIQTALVRCDPTRDEKACGLLQLSKTLPPEIRARDVEINLGSARARTRRSADRRICRGSRGKRPRSAGSRTRASSTARRVSQRRDAGFKGYPDGFEKYGIDPSDVAREVTAGIAVVQDLFPSEELARVKVPIS